MSILSKYNQATFDFETPEDFKYKKLSELFAPELDNTFKVNAIFINTNSKFGDGKSPVAVTDTDLVNLPQHLTETCENMLQDEDVIKAINNGNAGMTIYEYSNSFGTHHSVNFVDL